MKRSVEYRQTPVTKGVVVSEVLEQKETNKKRNSVILCVGFVAIAN